MQLEETGRINEHNFRVYDDKKPYWLTCRHGYTKTFSRFPGIGDATVTRDLVTYLFCILIYSFEPWLTQRRYVRSFRAPFHSLEVTVYFV